MKHSLHVAVVVALLLGGTACEERIDEVGGECPFLQDEIEYFCGQLVDNPDIDLAPVTRYSASVAEFGLCDVCPSGETSCWSAYLGIEVTRTLDCVDSPAGADRLAFSLRREGVFGLCAREDGELRVRWIVPVAPAGCVPPNS